MHRKIFPRKKPQLKKNLYCWIRLRKDEVDISSLRGKAIREKYREQTKRHITIIGGTTTEKIRNIFKVLDAKRKKIYRKKIALMLKRLQWGYYQKSIYHIAKTGYFTWDGGVRKEKRRAYIASLELPAIRILYRRINRLLHTRFPTQYPHITLYTKGEKQNNLYYGIPISSTKEFKSFHPKKIS